MSDLRMPLFVGIPTPDGRAPVMTINALKDMESLIGCKVMPLVAQGSSIVKNRNNILNTIREIVGLDTSPSRSVGPDRFSVPMLWVDSDIFLEYESIPEVAMMVNEVFDEVDVDPLSVVAFSPNYNMSNGWSALALHGGRHPKADELIHLDLLAYSGLGFLMLNMPVDYEFHSGPLGEDIYFFEEVPLNLRYWSGIKLWHQKLMVV